MHADFARFGLRPRRNSRPDLPRHSVLAERAFERWPVVAERFTHVCKCKSHSSPAAKVVDFGVGQSRDQPATARERCHAHRKTVCRRDDVRPIEALK